MNANVNFKLARKPINGVIRNIYPTANADGTYNLNVHIGVDIAENPLLATERASRIIAISEGVDRGDVNILSIDPS